MGAAVRVVNLSRLGRALSRESQMQETVAGRREGEMVKLEAVPSLTITFLGMEP